MTSPRDWHADNQRYLSARLADLLQIMAARGEPATADAVSQKADAIRRVMQMPPALEVVAGGFALSGFEQGVLLMCAGIELDSAFAERLAELGGGGGPTFGLALACLPGAHWSAVAPAAPLRRWRLIEPDAGTSLTSARLQIDERILHFLAGVQYLDDRLAACVAPLRAPHPPTESHCRVARRIVEALGRADGGALVPAIELLGTDAGGKRAVAAEVAHALGVEIFVAPAGEIPMGGAERQALATLWGREVALTGHALYIEAEDSAEAATSGSALARFIDAVPGLVLVGSPDGRRRGQRASIGFEVDPLHPPEQCTLWVELLAQCSDDAPEELQRVASQFRLGLDGLHAARAEVAGLLATSGAGTDSAELARRLWDACRRQARPRLDELAQRIEPTATWRDLVVPAEVAEALRQIAVHVRQRPKVLERWKLGQRSARGLGISVLFAGASGTGKTMGAEVLANELRLDLYRVDVSSVVSKYIGETEKNLCRIFEAAETGGAILLFDEADALFGKRSEVKDSHDRFANIQVSYLLQRMEAYRGLAILTTNMKSALDPAFLRRLRFVIEFPFPDAMARRRIWQGVFPDEAPTAKLDLGRLAALNVSGGHIRNIALGAAFSAAEEGAAIGMRHVLEAARREYRKLDKSLQAAKTGGWN